MLDRVGERFVFAVAQQPWEDEKNNIYNHFCALVPVVSCEDGTGAEPDDFPSFGQVWWKLQPHSRSYAKPGQLVTGKLSLSMYANSPGKDHYQVLPESVDLNVDRYFRQVITVEAPGVAEPKHLLSSRMVCHLPYIPAQRFWISWHGFVLGPFRAHCLRGDVDSGWSFHLATANQDGGVVKFPSSALQQIGYKNHDLEITVSKTNFAVHQTNAPLRCRYRLIEAVAFDNAIPVDTSHLVLESDEAILRRLAGHIVGRNKKRQFIDLAKELLPHLATITDVPESDISILSEICKSLDQQSEAAAKLADAVLDTGILQSQIEAAELRAAEEYVDRKVAALQVAIDERVKKARQELKELETRRSCEADRLETQRKEAKRQVENEIAAIRASQEAELQSLQRDIESQKAELTRQRSALHEAAQHLKDNQQAVINQFLALRPLLDQFDLLPKSQRVAEDSHASPVEDARFELPAFVLRQPVRESPRITEQEFLDRFQRHTEANGYRYRDIDRLAFHTSVKCGDITIVGGPPGTGKSSLVRLYAEALLGEHSVTESRRFLHVPVSPSWLDVRDVLGHVNALERKFQPSESGLVQFLICAAEELERLGGESGLHLACLDEMNLSHVEHYFSSFIQVLEQPTGRRGIQCFPDNVVSTSCPFHRWSRIEIARTVRFVGTVNFDETTKQLSQRLLDRTNLVRLTGDRPAIDVSEPRSVDATGSRVTYASLASWIAPVEGLEEPVGRVIDELREPLRRLGCPINPRTFTAIRSFIANYPGHNLEASLDLQLSQRVFSKLRSLFRPSVNEALDDVCGILDRHEFEFSETQRLLQELREAEISGTFGDFEINS